MMLVWIVVILIGVTALIYAFWRQRNQRSEEPDHLVKTMDQQANGKWSKPELYADISPLIGKQLVIAVRYPQGDKKTLVHFFGPIVRISEEEGIVINRLDDLGDFAVPPRAFLVVEHQRETRPTSMTQVIRPDYSTLIDLDGPPEKHGWNPAIDRHNPQ